MALAACFVVFLGVLTVPPAAVQPSKAPPIKKAVQEHTHVEITPQQQLKERKALFEPWLEAAEEVCNRTEDTEAQEVLSYLKENGRIISMTGEYSFILGDSPTEKMFFVAPMLPEDVRWGPVWMQRAQTSASVMFSPTDNMIVLKERAIGPLWKGILLLHETHHVVTFTREHYDAEDPDVYCAKERDTHAFENRLLAKIGGKTYALAKQQAKTLFNLRFEGENLLFDIPQTKIAAMDDAFGPSASEDEEASRTGAILIDVAFDALDEKYDPSKAATQKVTFLRRMYGK